MTSTRLRRAAATIPLAVALATTTSAAPALAAPTGTPASTSTATAHVSAHVFHGPLRDLQPAAVGPFDNADARLIMVSSRRNSTTFVFVFVVTGIDRAAAGTTYGAHLHVGPCVAGDPAAAGPHYNRSVIEGASPPVVNDQTEVWLDVTVGPGGSAVAIARVPFVPAPGNRAVVLHAEHTDDHGTAGARLACLPVRWS